jgi:hypothetical protein
MNPAVAAVRLTCGAAALAVLCVLAVSACGASSPSGPSQTPNPAPGGPAGEPQRPPLRIAADPVIDMTRGETRTLVVEESDASGGLVTRPATEYTWSSSDPDIASVGADGVLRARAEFGTAVISVRSASGLTATVRTWVQLPEEIPSTYRITLIFSDNVPLGWRPAFEWAAAQYERVIRARLPAVVLPGPDRSVCHDFAGEPPLPELTGTETGTRVYVGRWFGTGPTTGGPCLQRPLPRPTTIFGRITIPRGPLGDAALGPPGHRLALHEMGHALGLVGISSIVPSPGFDPVTRRHTGPLTLEGYRRAFGQALPFLEVPGSSHWSFGGDVMSAVSPEVRITKASAGALMDMGYPAAWYGAY